MKRTPIISGSAEAWDARHLRFARCTSGEIEASPPVTSLGTKLSELAIGAIIGLGVLHLIGMF